MSRTMTVTVGPFSIFFGNVNTAMGLKGHHHTGAVTLEYGSPPGEHGYPSFRETNDAIRSRLADLTGVRHTFRDATNEVVAERLFDAFDGWVAPAWQQWGGTYRLLALHLDVIGVLDDIGHDDGTTRYTVREDPAPPIWPGSSHQVGQALTEVIPSQADVRPRTDEIPGQVVPPVAPQARVGPGDAWVPPYSRPFPNPYATSGRHGHGASEGDRSL